MSDIEEKIFRIKIIVKKKCKVGKRVGDEKILKRREKIGKNDLCRFEGK